MGNCIGKRNYGTFFLFLLASCVAAGLALATSIAHILHEMDISLADTWTQQLQDALRAAPFR